MLTDQQARDLLHLAADTVPIGAASTSVSALGVAIERRRRWPVVAAAAAVALVLGGGVFVKHIASEETKSEPNVNPLTAQALRNYDPAAMPQLMDQASRAVFSRTFSDLPASQFKASGELEEALPAARYHQAHSMEVLYSLADQRELWLYLGHGRSYAEGDPEQICAGGLQSGMNLSCEVLRVGDDLAMVTVRATADGWMGRKLGMMPSNRGDANDRQGVFKADLEAVDPDALFFERRVKVVHSETFVSVVEEAVHVPDLDQAEQAFQVPVSDMVELATDPTMVIPEPDTVSAPSAPTELESADGQPCPSTLPYSEGDGFGPTTPATSPARYLRPDQAWVCGYAADLGVEGPEDSPRVVTWRQNRSAVTLTAAQKRDILPSLGALEPAEESTQICTDDLGPKWLLVLATDGDLTGVAVDSFGCGLVRFTENPHVSEPGDLSQTGVVGGTFPPTNSLLEKLDRAGSEGGRIPAA